MQTALEITNQTLTAGVDEVGRGPLVGSVVAAAVILDPDKPIIGLNDSKKLTEKKRESLYQEINDKALAVCVAEATSVEIDQINILKASLLAMKRAVEGLKVVPTYLLIDGNQPVDSKIEQQSVIKGDSKVDAIAAASIIAKVVRDRQMKELDQLYPEYGFAKHKGYPTKAHFEKLQQLGPIDEHRRSFGPVKRLVESEMA